jgi:hypothetical protein
MSETGEVIDAGLDLPLGNVTLEEPDTLFDRLRRAWANEKISPEILPYAADVIDEIDLLLAEQEERVAAMEADSGLSELAAVAKLEVDRIRYLLRSYLRTRLFKIQRFALGLVEPPQPVDALSSSTGMQTSQSSTTHDRVSTDRDVPSSDLRNLSSETDLRSTTSAVGANLAAVPVLNADAEALLSRAEQDFLVGYVPAIRTHFFNTSLHRLGAHYASVGVKDAKEDSIPRPNMDVHVFCRARRTTMLDEGSFESEPFQLDRGAMYVLKYSDIRSKIVYSDDCELL